MGVHTDHGTARSVRMSRPAYVTQELQFLHCDVMEMGGAVEQYMATRRWARATRRLNRYTLAAFVAAVGEDLEVAHLDHEAVARWWVTQSHVCASTARTRRSTVAGFVSWLRHTGQLVGDPLAGVPVPKEPRRTPVTLSKDEVRALLAVLPDDRAHAVATLMLGLGLRCVDVSRLDVCDVDLARRLLTITGKGGHVDVLPLPSVVERAVGRYLRRHPAPAGPLIRDARWHRHRVTPQRLSELFSAWCQDAGVKHRRHDGRGAHALRRTCATDLLDQGANVRQVQAVMRHASLSTTQRYLRAAEAEELRPVLERALT